MVPSIEEIRRLAGPEFKIGFVSGNFNVVHPGHLRLLRFAAEVSDFVVVGVNEDKTPGVSVPAQDRLAGVQSLSFVNHAVLLHEPASSFISKLKPEIVIKGKEYETHINPEKEIVASYGGRLVFSSGETVFASYTLLDDEFTRTNHSSIVKPRDYLERQGFQLADLRACVAKFKGLRVLVVGDLIIDEYITCEPLGMSQEDPTIVVTPLESKIFVGGAGVVSAHARNLGASVHFFTVVGIDEGAAVSYRFLQDQGITVHAFSDDTRPTTRKQRYRALGKTLLRVSQLRQHEISSEIRDKMFDQINQELDRCDLLLFSDFNYGCLPQQLVDAIVERAAARKIPMAADSQASSQMADISRFKGMRLITPTEREARMALRDNTSGLAVLAGDLIKKSEAEAVIITLGAEGMFIHAERKGTLASEKLPAFNTQPKDVAGAGDSLFTATSLALCSGADIWMSCYLGALAAGCQVSKVGNSPISIEDILRELDTT